MRSIALPLALGVTIACAEPQEPEVHTLPVDWSAFQQDADRGVFLDLQPHLAGHLPLVGSFDDEVGFGTMRRFVWYTGAERVALDLNAYGDGGWSSLYLGMPLLGEEQVEVSVLSSWATVGSSPTQRWVSVDADTLDLEVERRWIDGRPTVELRVTAGFPGDDEVVGEVLLPGDF